MFATVFQAFRIWEQLVKNMKLQSRFGVTILVKTMIFIKKLISIYGNLTISRIALARV